MSKFIFEQNILSTLFSGTVTEIWNIIDENQKVIDPTLPGSDYAYGIGLFIVPFDYCTT